MVLFSISRAFVVFGLEQGGRVVDVERVDRMSAFADAREKSGGEQGDGDLELTFLGTGTSSGVPVIACDCGVCCSDDPRDRRPRTSL